MSEYKWNGANQRSTYELNTFDVKERNTCTRTHIAQSNDYGDEETTEAKEWDRNNDKMGNCLITEKTHTSKIRKKIERKAFFWTFI